MDIAKTNSPATSPPVAAIDFGPQSAGGGITLLPSGSAGGRMFPKSSHLTG
jgi:hypothetical protein